jgi:hypothetical protein
MAAESTIGELLAWLRVKRSATLLLGLTGLLMVAGNVQQHGTAHAQPVRQCSTGSRKI